VVKLVLSVVTFVCELADVYDEGSFDPRHGYLYVTIVYNFSISLSLYFLVLFYESIKNILAPYKPLSKFLCIKSIVFFTFWQGLAISFMVYFNFGVPIPDYTVGEVATALQSFLICIEMFPLAIMHSRTFGHKAFQNVQVKQVTDSDYIHVFLDSFSLHDVVVDFFAALKKGPKRNVNVGTFLGISKEEQLNRVIKQDWLMKRGEDLIKKWKRRYFLLIDDPLGLVFFKYNPFLRHDNDATRLKARGFISLKEITAIVEHGRRGPGEFIIVTGKRKWHMKAPVEDKDEWIKIIREHIPQKVIASPEPEVEEETKDPAILEEEVFVLTQRIHEYEETFTAQKNRIQQLELLLQKSGQIVPPEASPIIKRDLARSRGSPTASPSPRLNRRIMGAHPVVPLESDNEDDKEIRIQIDENYEPKPNDDLS